MSLQFTLIRTNRRHLVALVGLLVFCFASVQSASARERIKEIRDPRYGVALYHYYQENFFDALSEMSVAQAQGGIQYHGSYPEFLQGSIELSYGMDRQAEQRFGQLLETEQSSEMYDQVWFYLGKMYYQREALDQAANAFSYVGENLPRRYRNEYYYLNLLLPNNWSDYKLNLYMKQLKGKDIWRAYTLYNYAMVQFQKEQYSDAILRLSQALDYVRPSIEGDLLRDRIFVARAYTHLANDDLDLAIKEFRRVSLKTPLSQHAMLGLGWAALKADQPQLALGAWKRLSRQPVAGAAVQESLLGVPYISEKLGAKQRALQGFQQAELRFLSEIKRIDDIKASLTTQQIYRELVSQRGEVSHHWFHRNKGIDVNPISPYLTTLVAKQGFQALLKDLRDLNALEVTAIKAMKKSSEFKLMLDARTQSQQNIASKVTRFSPEGRYKKIEKQYENVLVNLTQKIDTSNYIELLSGDDRRHYQRLMRAKKALSSLPEGDEKTAIKSKLNRLEGVLEWKATQQHPKTRWRLFKQRRELELQREELRSSIAVVGEKLENVAKPDEYNSRSEQLSARSTAALQRIRDLKQRIESEIQERMYKELDAQKDRMVYYIAQSRMNVARIMDETFQEQGGIK